MIRTAKISDIPKILRTAQGLCYIPKEYTSCLPVLIMKNELFIYEDDDGVQGFIRCAIYERTLCIDCVYATVANTEYKPDIIQQLIDYVITKFEGKADKIEIEFDAVGNSAPDLAVLTPYRFKMLECKVVSGTQHVDMPCDCAIASWNDRVDLLNLISQMCDEMGYNKDIEDNYVFRCWDSYKSTVVCHASDGHVVGFATICNSDVGPYSGIANVFVIYVKPGLRKHGIGKQLVRACQALAGKRRAHFIETVVSEDNMACLNLFGSFDIAVFRGALNYPCKRSIEDLTQVTTKVFA